MTRLLLGLLLTAVCARAGWAGDKTIEELKKAASKSGGSDSVQDKAGDGALIKEKLGAIDKSGGSKQGEAEDYLKKLEKESIEKEAPLEKEYPPEEPGPSDDGTGVSGAGGPSASRRSAGLPRGARPSSAGSRPMVTTPVPDQAGAPAPSSRDGAKAYSRANAAAAAMRSQFRSAEVLGEGGPGGAGSAAASPAAAAGAIVPHEPPSLANPRTEHDLVLAAGGGFGAAFKVMGLKAASGADGRPAIVRQDGRQASPEELDILKRLIVREPAALTKRPDYFSVIARSHFYKLRKDYETRPALAATAFKDVGMPETKRDFLWSESCSKVSGDCNPAAHETSYKRGDYVPPEDLNKIWERIKAESEDDQGLEEYSAEERETSDAALLAAERLSRGRLTDAVAGAVARRLGSLGAAIRGFFGDSGAPDSASAVSPGAGVGAPSHGAAADGGPSAGAAAASQAARNPAAPPPAPPADAPPAHPGKLLWLVLTGAALGAWLYRRG